MKSILDRTKATIAGAVVMALGLLMAGLGVAVVALLAMVGLAAAGLALLATPFLGMMPLTDHGAEDATGASTSA